MARRHRVLIAAQPAAWRVLQRMLQDLAELYPAHTPAEAFAVLHDGRAVDLIITTIAFDDSQMIQFLQAVKGDRAARDIPVLCARVLQSVLADDLVERVGAVCRECGAVDFVDVANVNEHAAQEAVRAAVAAAAHGAAPR